jgi:glycine cleavage system H protein
LNPPELKYTKEHEWVRIESGGLCTVGITAFAVESLGDIVYLELPGVDDALAQNEQFGEVESVKAVSELYSPVTGTVDEVNQAVFDTPEVVNDSPYGDGWLLKVMLADASEVDNLMTADQYEALLASDIS